MLEQLLTAVGMVTGVGFAVGPPAPDTYSGSWRNGCYEALAEDMKLLVGSGALDCGMVNFDAGEFTQARAEQCAKEAVATSQPFKFGYVGIGYDSTFCDIAIRSDDGQLLSMFVDLDVTGQYGTDGKNSALQISRCELIAFEPGTIYAGSFFHLSGCEPAPDLSERIFANRQVK